MIRYLFDTNVISEVVKPQPNPVVLERYQQHQTEGALTSTVLHELLYGVERWLTGKRRTELDRYFDEVVRQTLPILPFDQVAAEWLARERARMAALGTPRPVLDGMIAAVAATQSLVLVTRNVADFEGFDGLTVENLFEHGGS
ncbi:MAG: type II toxin-antitoxin system VapC family toxin [Bacteroidota bacterium]